MCCQHGRPTSRATVSKSAKCFIRPSMDRCSYCILYLSSLSMTPYDLIHGPKRGYGCRMPLRIPLSFHGRSNMSNFGLRTMNGLIYSCRRHHRSIILMSNCLFSVLLFDAFAAPWAPLPSLPPLQMVKSGYVWSARQPQYPVGLSSGFQPQSRRHRMSQSTRDVARRSGVQ